jgi:hypothetical protein
MKWHSSRCCYDFLIIITPLSYSRLSLPLQGTDSPNQALQFHILILVASGFTSNRKISRHRLKTIYTNKHNYYNLVHDIRVITGKTALFESYTFLEDYEHAVFTSLDFATILLLGRKVIGLASNPQPGRRCLCTFFLQCQSDLVIFPGTGLHFHHLLRLAGLRRRNSNLPPHAVSMI